MKKEITRLRERVPVFLMFGLKIVLAGAGHSDYRAGVLTIFGGSGKHILELELYDKDKSVKIYLKGKCLFHSESRFDFTHRSTLVRPNGT